MSIQPGLHHRIQGIALSAPAGDSFAFAGVENICWKKHNDAPPRRWRFACEHDWYEGPDDYAIGILWGRNMNAQPGEPIYRHRFLVRLKFRLKFKLTMERK